jgi:serine protease Do
MYTVIARRHVRLLVAAMMGLALTSPRIAAAGLPPPDLADTVGGLLPTVVVVLAVKFAPDSGDNQPPATHQERGSGFVIDPSGFIVTNKHVIDQAYDITITLPDGAILPARLAGESQRTDIALLKVDSKDTLQSARFGDSDKMRVGDAVVAIGNPLGFANSVSAGIVSALNRNVMESPFDDYIQTDAAINHGNSGGPLFNIRGEVIGMNSLIFAPGDYGGSIGLGFAIPSNDVRFVVDRLRAFGAVRPGYIGVQFQEVNRRLDLSLGLPPGADGAIIVEVTPDSGAAKAGLHVGDVVLEFDGQHVADARGLGRAIAKAPVNQTSSMMVWRDGHILRFDVDVTVEPDQAPMGAGGAASAKAAADKATSGLGLTLAEVSETTPKDGATPSEQHGAQVTAIAPNSAAADAGLVVGDVVLMAGQAPVDGPAQVMNALQASRMAGRAYTPFLVRSHDGSLRWIALAAEAE